MLIITIISKFAYICVMVAVITGDIIHSARLKPRQWMSKLKTALAKFGDTPQNWEIYRGDSFQLEIKKAENALWAAIHLKAMLKMTHGLDARLSIGFGKKDFKAKKISEANGSAFVNAGHKFDTLKSEKVNMAMNSGNEKFDNEMNLYLRFALTFMDSWSVTSATLINVFMSNPGKTQSEIAALLKINQSAVSQRKKRAHFDLIEDLDKHFKQRIKEAFA